MKQINYYTGSKKRPGWLWQFAMVVLAGILVTATNAFSQAVLPGVAPVDPPKGGFGIDGDLRANTPSVNIGDWLPGNGGTGGSVLSATGVPLNLDKNGVALPSDKPSTFKVVDLYTSGDNVFAGGQKKNDNPNFMTWIEGNPSPSKNDINNFYMHISRDTNGDTWITISGDRESTNGNSFISIALHQYLLKMNPGGTFTSEAPAGTGGRAPGDLQVSAEFTGGGSNPNLYLEEWKLSEGTYQWVSTPVPANSAYGKTNASVINGVPYDVFGGSSYPVNAFIEVSFNISAFYRNTSTPCVGSITSAFVMTKSSQSVSANLTDFVAPIEINLDINVGRPVASGDDYCVNETINSITATGEAGATFKWYGGLDSNNKPVNLLYTGATFTPTISNTTAGSATYYVTQTIRGCESMPRAATINVYDNPTITSPAVGPICVGTAATSLSYTGITAGADKYKIVWNSGLTSMSDYDDLPVSPIAISGTGSLAANSYTGTIYVKNSTTGCESAGAPITLVVNPNPTASAGTAPTPQCYLAAGNTFNLSGSGSNGSPLWTVQSNPNSLTVDITNENTYTPSVTVSGSSGGGTVTLRLTVASEFDPSCGSKTSDVSVVVNPNPTANAGTAPDAQCYNALGNTFILGGSGSNGSPEWSVFSKPDGWTVEITGGTTLTPSVKVTGTSGGGTVVMRLTVTSNSAPTCGSKTSDVSLVINEQPVGPDVDYIAPLCNETTFKVKVNNPVAGTKYTLSRDNYADMVINYTSGDAVFENLEPGSGYSVVASIGDCRSGSTSCGDSFAPVSGLSNTSSLQSAEAKIADDQLTAYPVPFSERVTLEFKAERAGNYVINLYDMKGALVRELKSGTAKAGEVTLIEVDGRMMADGMYLARMMSGSGTKTVKLLKKNR